MADNYQALEPTTAPAGTQLITIRAPEIDGRKHAAAILYAADGTALLGQQDRERSLPTTIATEDLAALIAALGAIGGAVAVSNLPATQAVSGPLTDAQLRASVVAMAGNVGGYTRIAAGSMTRPADTTPYTAGDGVTTATSGAIAMTITGAARLAGGSGVIIGGRALKSSTSTTNAAFRLWIYQDATGVAIPNDNAAFSPAVVADRLKLIGTATADFSAVGLVGSDGVSGPISLSRPQLGFTCASGSTALLVIWQATAAYAPASAETFHLILDTLAD